MYKHPPKSHLTTIGDDSMHEPARLNECVVSKEEVREIIQGKYTPNIVDRLVLGCNYVNNFLKELCNV